MAGTRKMVDEGEVRRWIEEEGRTYAWMVDEYARKYDLRVSASMFSEFRATRGLRRRTVRDDDLIPWKMEPHHRHHSIVTNLRTEARIRAGESPENLSYGLRTNWRAFRRKLATEDLVFAHDPSTKEGFRLVPRSPRDTDLIRQPERLSARGRGRRD